MHTNEPTSTGRFRVPAESLSDAISAGNRLRRFLLDDLRGSAPTAVRIEGIQHEFQAIPGVYEDALQLINNIKRIRVSGAAKATLDCAKQEITAGDLKIENGAIANPDQVIAHLSPGASLKLEIAFGPIPEGFIPLQTVATPIRRVAIHEPVPSPGGEGRGEGAISSSGTIGPTSHEPVPSPQGGRARERGKGSDSPQSPEPLTQSFEIEIETDTTVSPEAALQQAMQSIGDIRAFETLPVEPPKPRPSVDLGPEFHRDPFMGTEPQSGMEHQISSYRDFLERGIPKLLDTLFPLTSRSIDAVREPGAEYAPAHERRIDLIGHRLQMPSVAPEQCAAESRTYEARLILNVRVHSSTRDRFYGPGAGDSVASCDIDMGPIPLMTDAGTFVIHGASRTCVMLTDGDYRVRRVGELITHALERVITTMKPVLEDRMDQVEDLRADILNMLPLSATVHDLLTSASWCQYTDETNSLAHLTHGMRVVSSYFVGGGFRDEDREMKMGHFGRLGYLESPEGPNIGLVNTLAPYASISSDGDILTPYRKVENGRATDELVYLTASEDVAYKIADATAVGPDGSFVEDYVMVRDGDDIRRLPASQVQLVAVSPSQHLSVSSTQIPFLGHNEYVRALVASNMLRQSVPLLAPEQPLVKSGCEAMAAVQSGRMVVAKRAGRVVEADGARVVVLADGERDIYDFRKFARTNQATMQNHTPAVRVGQDVAAGQVLADASDTRNGELALGRNILVAYMPLRGYNFEDAICISEELADAEAFTSVSLEHAEAEVNGLDVWTAPVGARLNPGDALVQESGGRRRTLLTVPPVNPVVVTEVKRFGSRIRFLLADTRRISIGDKLAGRSGNKGIIGRILPRSEMPYTQDGTPVQMVINTHGVISRMNLGQVLETHYGALAHTLGTQIVMPPFMDPPHDVLQAKLKEAGLDESGMVTLFDGCTGRPFESPVTVGYQYIVRLNHMVSDKIAAISTASTSLLAHQPTMRIRTQRAGFLELWALEAYNAGSNLQEVLTVRSEYAEHRERAASALLAGDEVEPVGEGQSLRLLENALLGLGICVEEAR